MINILALCVITHKQFEIKADPSLPKASELFSKMLVRYNDAEFGSGQIQWRQSSGKFSKSLTSTLAYKRVNQLYLLQNSNDIKPGRWLTVCDGSTVSFDPTPTLRRMSANAKRLMYPTAINGRVIRLPEVFSLSRASLGDVFNPFFIILFSSKENNNALKEYIARIRSVATTKQVILGDNTKGYQIEGMIQLGTNINEKYSPLGDPTADLKENVARMRMIITESNDLREVEYIERYSGLESNNPEVITEVKTVWSGKIDTDQEPNKSLFVVTDELSLK
jgi:hypothetical protein